VSGDLEVLLLSSLTGHLGPEQSAGRKVQD
jgi:hypothetical protein